MDGAKIKKNESIDEHKIDFVIHKSKIFGSNIVPNFFFCSEGQYLAQIKFQIVKEIRCVDAS